MTLTLEGYLITDNVMAVADKMRKELQYSTKVKECSLSCEIATHPLVVSTLHDGVIYKLYMVKSIHQIPMQGRYFHTFSDAFKWATGGWAEARFSSFGEFSKTADSFFSSSTGNSVSPWEAAMPELKHHIVPDIKRIEQNIKKDSLYTTVIWADGSKPTVVKLANGEPPHIYNAVASAIAIKMYGSNSAYIRMINEKKIRRRK